MRSWARRLRSPSRWPCVSRTRAWGWSVYDPQGDCDLTRETAGSLGQVLAQEGNNDVLERAVAAAPSLGEMFGQEMWGRPALAGGVRRPVRRGRGRGRGAAVPPGAAARGFRRVRAVGRGVGRCGRPLAEGLRAGLPAAGAARGRRAAARLLGWTSVRPFPTVAASWTVPAPGRRFPPPGTPSWPRRRWGDGEDAPPGLRRPLAEGTWLLRLQVPALALGCRPRGSGGPDPGLLRPRLREAVLRPLRSRARALPDVPPRVPRRLRRQRAPGGDATQARRGRAPSLPRRRGRGARAGRPCLASADDVEAWFHREWVRALFTRAVAALEGRCREEGPDGRLRRVPAVRPRGRGRTADLRGAPRELGMPVTQVTTTWPP